MACRELRQPGSAARKVPKIGEGRFVRAAVEKLVVTTGLPSCLKTLGAEALKISVGFVGRRRHHRRADRRLVPAVVDCRLVEERAERLVVPWVQRERARQH